MDAGAPPRVLAVNHTGLVSGAEAVLLRVLGAACLAGWPVVVASPDGPLAERSEAAGLAHLELPDLMLPSGPRRVAAANLAVAHARAARRLRRAADDCDLVVANGIRVLPTLRLARPSAPVVWIAHNLVDRPRWHKLLRVTAPVVDLVLAGSSAVIASLAMPRLPSRVVRYGTPWPVAPVPAARPGRPVVGCAALLTPWKGQDVLLEAVAHLARPDVSVELLGGSFPKDGTYVEALRGRAARSDLVGRVHFAGHLDEPMPAMRGWTVAVVASVDPEAGPLSMLEAMSIGLPVVATDHGGPPELLGDAGLLVPPGDPTSLATAIARLIDDEELHRRCSLAGPRRVASGLTLEAQVQGILAAFEEVAAAGQDRVSRRRGR